MALAPLQQFVEELKNELRDNLISVTLFGPEAITEQSAASDSSGYSLLLVVGDLDAEALNQMAGPIARWRSLGQPRPLIFTEKRLHQSGESFSVELLDMKEARRVLFGRDSIIELEIDRIHFQQSLASNLKRELLSLRSGYLEGSGSPGKLRATLLDSDFNLRLLERSALRLFMPVAPSEHHAVIEALKIHLPIDPTIFHQVDSLRNSTADTPDNLEALYLNFIQEVEKIIDGTDRLMQRRAIPLTHPPFNR